MQLEASASSGRSGLDFGRFVPERFVPGSSFLKPRFWAFCPGRSLFLRPCSSDLRFGRFVLDLRLRSERIGVDLTKIRIRTCKVNLIYKFILYKFN